MITVQESAPPAAPWHLDQRSWLLVLLSGQCLQGALGDAAAELKRMEHDGLVTSAFDGRRRDYALTDEGWDAASDARRCVIESHRFLGVLQERYAMLHSRVRP